MGKILTANPVSIAQAAELIRDRQEVVAYPTETCYGLAVNACDRQALARLLRVKRRAPSKPIAVLVAGDEMLNEVVVEVPRLARELMAAHWPGALTLVLPAAAGVPAELQNQHGGIGVRMSCDPIAQQLVVAVGSPITTTSANSSGALHAHEAAAAMLDGVALVLDDGPRTGVPSTVACVSNGRVVVLRQGTVEL